MMIYICHKYGGKEENKNRVEQIIKDLIKRYPEHTFISPIHTFGFLYNDVSYDKGMEYCYNLLSKCDEMWICSERSKGVELEIQFCKRNNIEIKYLLNFIGHSGK